MSRDDAILGLLGGAGHDDGCDAAFAVLDQYVEAELTGEDAPGRWPGVAVHLRGCPACREDADGLRATLHGGATAS